MALSPEEQAELESLKPTTTSKLSPEEQAELESLKSETKPKYDPKAMQKMMQEGSEAAQVHLSDLAPTPGSIPGAALSGITSGATLGGQNVLGGGIQAGLDIGQSALHNIGLASESPSQVGARLAKQGTKGDIGPTSASDVYYKGKEETKKDFDTAQAAHPLTYGAGQLAGAFGTPGIGLLGKAASKAVGAGAELVGTTGLTTEAIANLAKSLGVSTEVATKIAAKAATTSKAAATGGLVGAGVGGASGFLGGNAPISQPGQVLGETLGGAAKGAAIGTALGGAGGLLGIGTGKGPLQSTAENRQAAAYGVEPEVQAQRNVGKTLMESKEAGTLKGGLTNTGRKANLDQRVGEIEDTLDSSLKEVAAKRVPEAEAETKEFVKQKVNELSDKQAALAKQREAASDIEQANAMGEHPPMVPPDQISPLPPEVAPEDITGSEGGMPEDVTQQLRQQLNPVAKEQAQSVIQGETPAISPEELAPTSTTEALPPSPEVIPSAPEIPLPKSILNKQDLAKQFETARQTELSKHNPRVESGMKGTNAVNRSFDDEINHAIDNSNDIYQLHKSKKAIYDDINKVSGESDAWNPMTRRLVPEKQAYVDARKAQARILNNQVSNMADAISPEFGQKVRNLLQEEAAALEAKKGLEGKGGLFDKVTPLDLGKSAYGYNAGLFGKILSSGPISTPANLALSKGAAALSTTTPAGMAGAVSGIVNKATQPSTAPSPIFTPSPGAQYTPSTPEREEKSTMYNQDKQKYNGWAAKLASNPVTAHIGTALSKAVANNDSLGQTQALFVIDQTPNARKVLGEDIA